ncbi:MAG: PKD domain-containing protein [Bacteroidales bacterium]|nr:PKD domain-containing protein [Bacteroidales bacterium]MBN2764641.1 PKD domain-containing protein [Bacteroidales bacterium]
MRGTFTKLLTATTLLLISFQPGVFGQCALISDNFSGQVPSSVCAPVDLSMDVRYKFILPVDPSRVQILYVWNDGTGATDLVPAVSQGDTVFTATAAHLYPPAENCSYTAEAYVVFDGETCVSSSRQEQTFSAWARDNENGAVIITDPVVAQFCEGEEIIDVRFRDNSTFNCNIGIEPDKPNRITRWVQFIYGTASVGGNRIPNVTIEDPLGNVYQMTDVAGNSLPPVAGPIVEIPIPADGPTEISWPISAPAGGIAGDIFEITMRNWNICNPYDRNPFDAIPPTDLVDGDYDPITTTGLIEIITTPPQITNPSLEFCAGSPINLTLSTSGGTVNWYTDSLLTNYIHTGNSFDPTGAPTYIDNSVGGQYSYFVTESIGACASAPSEITFRIYDTPAPTPDAGRDSVICGDTYQLQGNVPVIGTGMWTTTGGATVDDPTDPKTWVHNLDPGPNLFRWTLTNGPCISMDEVIIARDLQPAPANAGPDVSFCDNSTATLQGNAATNNGQGTWDLVSGNGNIADLHQHNSDITEIAGGENRLAWTIESQFGACITTSDTMTILRDRTPDPADAGPDRGVCDSVSVNLAALPATNGGNGVWSVITGGGLVDDPAISTSLVSNLAFGTNQLRWTVTSQYGICAGTSDDVIISRDEAPAASFAGFDQALCNAVSSPLGANAATVGTGTWSVVTNPSGINPVFSPDIHDANATIQILPGNEGLYEVAWTIVNLSCRTSDTMVVDFGVPVPPADAGPSDSVCGTTAVLTGNNPGICTGTWTKISGSGDVEFIPGPHSPGALARIGTGEEGWYSFEWRITSGSCPPTADTVSILYMPTPGVPGVSDESRCGPGQLTLGSTIGLGGNRNHWHKNASTDSLLFTGVNFTTPAISSTSSYWVSTYNDTTGCESTRRRVNAIINPIPGIPVVSDIENCGGDIFTIPAKPGTNGTTARWYDAPVGGTLLDTDTSYTTGTINVNTTLWVSSYNDTTGCEGSRIPVNIVIHPVPSQPFTNDESRCGAGTLTLTAAMGAGGTSLRWYDAPSGGTIIDTAATFTTPFLTATRSYWITSYNDSTGCESQRKEVRAVVNPVPGFPVVNDISNCGPDSLVFLSVPGAEATTSRWYDSLTGGNLIHEGNTFTSPFLLTTQHYYVSGYNGNTGCESSRVQVSGIILPAPGPNPVIGASQVGVGQSNVIYSVNYQPGSTYDWNIPPGVTVLLSNLNFVILEFPNLGTYTISVQETNSIGCPGPVETKLILVKENVILIDLNITQGETCVGENLQIAATPSGGTPSYAITWFGAVQYLSATDIANPVFNANLPGVYRLYVNVTDINANQANDSITVTVHPNPYAQITTSDTIVCAGDDHQLGVMIAGGSGNYPSYQWTGQTQPLSSTTTTSPVFNTVIKGFYNLKFEVTDNNGCRGSDSIILYNDMPKAVFTSDAMPQCSPVEVHFTNASEDAVEYLWDFGDGDTSGAENPYHLFRNISTSVEHYNVVLTSISQNGCMHTTNEYITVYPNPVTTISMYPEKACHPAEVLLSATPGGFRYDWDFGDGSSEEGNFNTLHTFINTTEKDTTYNVTLITTSFFNCLDTTTMGVTVYPSPEASFIATPLSQMYPERTVTLTNTTPDRNWDYTWYFGDKTISFERDPGAHSYPEPDEYTLKLVVKGEHCYDSVITMIEIVPHPPVAQFKPVRPGCMPLTIQFENSSSFSNSFLWEFGDGAVSNKPNPEYTYYEAGVYKIKLTAWGDGGVDTYSTTNDVWLMPKAYFETAPRFVYVNDQSVHFFNLSDNGDIYEWDFGDGTTSSEFNPKHLYAEEGNYDVTLNVWTENGCHDLYVLEEAVLVKPSGKIVFPNAFRPESPVAENRVFMPAVIDNVDEYHLMIFNRWGELVFESFDKDTGWDGYVDGKMAKQDVYVWKVEGKYSNGKGFLESGDVTLMH